MRVQEGPDPRLPTFREISADNSRDSYEPQVLWLLPVLLRSRRKYYDDAIAAVQGIIDDLWNGWKQPLYDSREDFECSRLVDDLWRWKAPPWWGLNDIIGFIDVRVCVRDRELQAALFLPNKRISRRLRNKEPYFFQRRVATELLGTETNEELRSTVISMVDELRKEPRIGRCYVDVARWQRLVEHTDVRSIIRDAAECDVFELA